MPHVLVGGAAMLACLADLETVISALMTSRILIQFAGQIATIVHVRTRPELRSRLRFRMWLYPLPALMALVGWVFVLGASTPTVLPYGVGSMVLGGLVFLVLGSARQARRRRPHCIGATGRGSWPRLRGSPLHS